MGWGSLKTPNLPVSLIFQYTFWRVASQTGHFGVGFALFATVQNGLRALLITSNWGVLRGVVWGVPLIFITPSAENACFGGIWGSGGWSQGVPICIHYRYFGPWSTSLFPQKVSIHNWYTQCDSPCFGGGYRTRFHRLWYVE